MIDFYNHRYPSIDDLKIKAKKRMPKFAYDYLVGGCMNDVALCRNREDINEVQLRSELLKPFSGSNLTAQLFGHTYSAPFGIAPIGLQGLMWPKAPEILAEAACEANIPFILSTVSSSGLETIAEKSQGRAWFQLYNPTDAQIRDDLLRRVSAAQYQVLVITVDVPTFGYRPRDIKNGLAMPPKMSVSNILQMVSKPRWLFETALAGKPQMETLLPYMPKDMPNTELADFMNKTVMGKVDLEALKPLRDKWKGALIVKGITNVSDAGKAVELGADGILVSNHGARQLDAGESPVRPLKLISATYGDQIKVMMDGGLRSGANIASALACGADFTFLGRPFVYGVGALGGPGGVHTINLLKMQLKQVMNQLGCATVADAKNHLVDAQEYAACSVAKALAEVERD